MRLEALVSLHELRTLSYSRFLCGVLGRMVERAEPHYDIRGFRSAAGTFFRFRDLHGHDTFGTLLRFCSDRRQADGQRHKPSPESQKLCDAETSHQNMYPRLMPT